MTTVAWGSGMAWWLSSAVCSFTVISKLYTDREILVNKGLYHPIGYLVSIVLGIMATFSFIVFYDLGKIENSLYKIFIEGCETFKIPDIEYIFALVKKLYLLSFATMITFLLMWLYIWFYNKPNNLISKP